MGFLDMGALEILLIMVVALIIWGPAKIPEIARTLGRTMRALRKITSDLTTTITRELDLEEENRPSQPKDSSRDETKEATDADKTEPSDTGKTDPGDQ